MAKPQVEPVSGWDWMATWATFPNGTFHSEYGGVELQKCNQDLRRYRELVEISQPDILVETGTRSGGSALWFHRELDLQVVSIDIAPDFGRRGGPPHLGPGIEWVRGSSVSFDVFNLVLPLLKGKRVMVSLDSDHHAGHVMSEIAVWRQFVSPGCYLVVEDGCFDMFDRNGRPEWAQVGGSRIPDEGGPLRAIYDVGLPASPRWWRDENLEGLSSVSHSPCGWWRRHE